MQLSEKEKEMGGSFKLTTKQMNIEKKQRNKNNVMICVN